MFPNPLAAGYQDIRSSLLFGGSDFANLGQPAALTSVLDPAHEFTVLVRTCRVAIANTGIVVGRADNSNTSFSIASTGGNSWILNVGGTVFTSGSGSYQGAVWDTIALANRNNGDGTFKARSVLNANVSTAESTSGAQVASGKDILVGARRAASNADSSTKYTGWIGTVAIWNRALTDDEIHYAMGLLTPAEMLSSLCPSGLIAYIPCSERGGTTIHDIVAGNDGALTSNVFTTTDYPKPPLVAIGDSLANGSGSPTGKAYCMQAIGGGSGCRNMRATKTYGFSGQNNAFVLTQVQLSTFAPFYSWTPVLQPGAHDIGNSTVIAANITWLQTVLALFPHGRWAIMGQRRDGVGASGAGSSATAGIGDYGTTRRMQVDALDYALRAFAGAHWMDTQILSVSLANLPTEANDVFQLRTPVHLCADGVHPLDAFYIAESVALDACLNRLGY